MSLPLFVIITAAICVLLVIAVIRTAKDKNLLGVGFSLVALGVFGWFTVMTIYEWINNLGT